jgi:hypothetical protein
VSKGCFEKRDLVQKKYRGSCTTREEWQEGCFCCCCEKRKRPFLWKNRFLVRFSSRIRQKLLHFKLASHDNTGALMNVGGLNREKSHISVTSQTSSSLHDESHGIGFVQQTQLSLFRALFPPPNYFQQKRRKRKQKQTLSAGYKKIPP